MLGCRNYSCTYCVYVHAVIAILLAVWLYMVCLCHLTGGGRFWDLGSHCVDQFQSLYPHIPIRSVYCRMIYNLPIASDVDSFVQITIVLEDETTCVIDCNSIASVEK